MKIVATYSIKGGVGKTAAAVNLGYEASRNGLTTLIWDLDPQGAATYSYRIKPKVKGGARAVIEGDRDLDDAIRGTDYEDLDLVPADFSFRNFDVLLDDAGEGAQRVRPREGRKGRPRALCGHGPCDRGIHLVDGGPAERRDRLGGGGVDDVERAHAGTVSFWAGEAFCAA